MRSRFVLLLFLFPSTASAQIAPSRSPQLPSALSKVTIRPDPGANRDIEEADQRIREGRKGGTLTKAQARKLRRETDFAKAAADRSAQNGLSYSEQRGLDMHGRALQSIVAAERSRPPR